jgi:hypothetical protein
VNHNTWTGKIENSWCFRKRIERYVIHRGALFFWELEAKGDEAHTQGMLGVKGDFEETAEVRYASLSEIED